MHDTSRSCRPIAITSFVLLALIAAVFAQGQLPPAATPGGPDEPVRYVGNEAVLPYHEGGLRLAVGAKNFQVFRANRAHPEMAEGTGWTYNHAPMLAYWNGKFYLEYLSSPVNENKPPMHSMLTTSTDGINWETPRVVFPEITLPNGLPGMVHQRMGFYVAPDGRLLVLGFYGYGPHVNDGGGVGRVVREVYRDGKFGPVYFIRYSTHNGFGEKNTNFPLYKSSTDEGFKAACEALLANKLVTMQWWEEDRAQDGFYFPMGIPLKALSFYHRKDGAVTGLWKSSWSSVTTDEGKTWSKPVKARSLVMAEAKVWGQRTKDGRYALLYNPRADNRHRWPLAIVTGEDGITFDNMLTVCGEVAPRRYNGLDKAFGPQYVRGIVEGNGIPPGNTMWATYSMNKDDLWVTRIPLPVRGTVQGQVHDDFNTAALEDLDWNIYSPRWAPVRIADFPGSGNRSLEIADREPYDYAKAVRVFPESQQAEISFRIFAKQANSGQLDIELDDRYGWRSPVRLRFDERGHITALDGNRNEPVSIADYKPGTWYRIAIRVDVKKGGYDVLLDGAEVLKNAETLDPVQSLERITFRTGPYRIQPILRDPKSPGEDVASPDDPVPPAVFYIDDVEVQPGPRVNAD
jgi:hypothetical protein